MKRILSVTLGVTASVLSLGVIVAVAGPIVYGTMSATPSAAPDAVLPTVLDNAAVGIPHDVAELAGAWTVDKGSTAGYTVQAVLNGSEVSITGSTQNVTGRAEVHDEMLTAATASVDVATIMTDNANRDAYFRDRALDTELYPTAIFSLSEPIPIDNSLLDGKPMVTSATGELTLHGVTRTVEANLLVAVTGRSLSVGGSVPVSFEQFNVTAPDLGFVRVADSGSINFSLTVSPQ